MIHGSQEWEGFCTGGGMIRSPGAWVTGCQPRVTAISTVFQSERVISLLCGSESLFSLRLSEPAQRGPGHVIPPPGVFFGVTKAFCFRGSLPLFLSMQHASIQAKENGSNPPGQPKPRASLVQEGKRRLHAHFR